MVQAAVLGLVVFIGASQVIEGVTSLGTLMAFVTYQQMFAESSSKLLEFAGRFRMLDVHLQRIADVILTEPERDDALWATAPHAASAGRRHLAISVSGAALAGGRAPRFMTAASRLPTAALSVNGGSSPESGCGAHRGSEMCRANGFLTSGPKEGSLRL